MFFIRNYLESVHLTAEVIFIPKHCPEDAG